MGGREADVNSSTLCVGALIEAVRDRTQTVDLKQVNAVLMQPHWRHNTRRAGRPGSIDFQGPKPGDIHPRRVGSGPSGAADWGGKGSPAWLAGQLAPRRSIRNKNPLESFLVRPVWLDRRYPERDNRNTDRHPHCRGHGVSYQLGG
ncbi:MAG: hypothetical protein K9N23_22015 [Akkermansiaceae bacterium]|nr:hypothetical protein [Akkermansiaceae bacterium]